MSSSIPLAFYPTDYVIYAVRHSNGPRSKYTTLDVTAWALTLTCTAHVTPCTRLADERLARKLRRNSKSYR